MKDAKFMIDAIHENPLYKEKLSMADECRELLRLMGKDENDFEHVIDRPGHDMRYAIDGTRLREELGWEPQFTDFEAGLADTIAWYTDNRSWWEPLKAEVEAKYAKAGQ